MSCYARYDNEGKKVRAEATFHDSQTKQVVDNPGGVRFQSLEMTTIPVMGITYTADYPASFTKEMVFEWQNAAKEPVKYTLEAPSIDSFAFNIQELSIKHSAFLQWKGSALGKGETLIMMWENAQTGATVPMEVSTTLGAPMIEVPAAKLAQLGPGKWTLYLVRKKFAKTELKDYFVESIGEYYTKPQPVTIVH